MFRFDKSFISKKNVRKTLRKNLNVWDRFITEKEHRNAVTQIPNYFYTLLGTDKISEIQLQTDKFDVKMKWNDSKSMYSQFSKGGFVFGRFDELSKNSLQILLNVQ